jgi:hypothetical protein
MSLGANFSSRRVIQMPSPRAWTVEVREPTGGISPLISRYRHLTAPEAVSTIEKNFDKALRLQDEGNATEDDYELLKRFEHRTGMHLPLM